MLYYPVEVQVKPLNISISIVTMAATVSAIWY